MSSNHTFPIDESVSSVAGEAVSIGGVGSGAELVDLHADEVLGRVIESAVALGAGRLTPSDFAIGIGVQMDETLLLALRRVPLHCEPGVAAQTGPVSGVVLVAVLIHAHAAAGLVSVHAGHAADALGSGGIGLDAVLVGAQSDALDAVDQWRRGVRFL